MSLVAAVRTNPQNVVNDYGRVMHLAKYQDHIAKKGRTIIKLNLSWSLYYPACSTEPWQLEGVLKTLREDGYTDITAVENRTVVTNLQKGAKLNQWLPVLKKYDVPLVPLYETEWVTYKPQHELRVLDKKVFDHVEIPKLLMGASVIHLPTIKTHGHSTMTGAMKNAFGGLLKVARHHCHKHIHDVLVDLLTIQQEIHPGLFAVTDGTVCGDGAGPRTMVPRIGNVILASGDMVAIDAVSSKIMGFDPMTIRKLKIANDMGLGCADLSKIQMVGDDISEMNMHFQTGKSPVIFFDQLLRSSFIQPLLFRTWFFNLCIAGSAGYHDYLWYPTVGRQRVRKFSKTEWGQLFKEYAKKG
jgi:uncharacterized protein (DUF362 family)